LKRKSERRKTANLKFQTSRVVRRAPKKSFLEVDTKKVKELGIRVKIRKRLCCPGIDEGNIKVQKTYWPQTVDLRRPAAME